MKLFLSYSSQDETRAEEIALALRGAGYDVFFDRSELPPGGDYNQRLSDAIAESDGVIFLISRGSLKKGSYALTELKLTQGKWKHPKECVLPVLIDEISYDKIPAYLRAVTILEPEGNVAAEIVHAVEQWSRPSTASRGLMEDVMKLAEQGKADAQIALANAYASGAGVPLNENEAIRWYTTAALGGNKNAAAQLAKFLWKLADNGDVNVQYMLGSCYQTGEIWPADIEMAKHWLQRAAEQGHEEAANELQRMNE